ncbi:hypothetical protein [Litorilituus lipolyticus]|uniref:Uncharacterized protein n=1 Tax=Litorilituus lipolyticus TaxID=2491017 RepID=A0A502KSU8_9GAMM|nr:hypothetical protein [Litorilituus lipolyticus]TPH14672.1 hypothetical protein EPA86_11310 [Litorilituus lipolyticus]
MAKQFRESKYLNESGTAKGNWYMNRLDYFKFYQYPEYKKHKILSLLIGIICFLLTLKLLPLTFWGALPFLYISYLSMRVFVLLHTRVCRYKGYFLIPKKIVAFLRAREIELDVNDFDSVATMNNK